MWHFNNTTKYFLSNFGWIVVAVVVVAVAVVVVAVAVVGVSNGPFCFAVQAPNGPLCFAPLGFLAAAAFEAVFFFFLLAAVGVAVLGFVLGLSSKISRERKKQQIKVSKLKYPFSMSTAKLK